jgi:hypothetical protein
MPTLTLQVGQSSDDASANSTTAAMNLTGTTVNWVAKISTSWVCSGFRWLNCTVPATATISACSWEPYFTSTTNTGTGFIWFQNNANPSTFTTSETFGSFSRLGSSVTWTPGTLGSAGFNSSPDLSSQFAAVIALGGYAAGNAVSILTEGDSTTGQTSTIDTYDNSSSEGAELSITYTSGGSPTPHLLCLTGCGG